MNRKILQEIRKGEKRAISPIIATLLLILIAIAAGVVVYAYVIGFVGTGTTGQPTGTSQLSVDVASGSAGGTSVTAFVRNVGGTTASVTAFYILDSTGAIVTGGAFIGTSPQGVCVTPVTSASGLTCTLAPTSTFKIAVTGITMSAGNTYTLKITTSDGSAFTYSFRAGA